MALICRSAGCGLSVAHSCLWGFGGELGHGGAARPGGRRAATRVRSLRTSRRRARGSWWWAPTTGPSSSRPPPWKRPVSASCAATSRASRHFPCNALIEGRTCPLDVGFDVVATVRARPLDTMAPGELGVVCALRHGIPLVAAGVAPDRPFGPWAAITVEQGGELVGACEKVAGEAFAEFAGGPPVGSPIGGL